MANDELLTTALQLLRRADIRISGGNLDALSLILPDHSTREVSVHAAAAPPTPSMIETLTARPERQLVVTRRRGEAVLQAAIGNLLDLIVTDPATVIAGGRHWLDVVEGTADEPSRHRGRTPWGRWAILRALMLAAEPMTQTELADSTGITQPGVAKNLKLLDDWIDRSRTGWSVKDWHRAVEEWLKRYPGPRGATTYWYSLKTPAEQATAAAEYAREMGADPLVSGDAAADIYAPWRLPDTVRIYLKEAVDFTDAGFTPSSEEEATLLATIPEDSTLWRTASTDPERKMQLADWLMVTRDVSLGGAPDSAEAADHLLKALHRLQSPMK